MRVILILTLIPFILVIVLAGMLITNPEIEYQIGQSFIRGDVVPKNQDWGFFWVTRAADGGYADAQALLGRSYLVGLPKQDLKQAIKYLSMGEKANNNECLKLLAYANTYGQGVPQDFGRSIDLSKRSLAIERDGRELMSLSFLHLILPAKYSDYKKSEAYSDELRKLGYTSAWSYWSLGIINEYGLAGKVDHKAAAKSYEQGSLLGDNDSQYALVRAAMEGKFPDIDRKTVRTYLDNSANTQILDAQILLALVLATENRDQTKGKSYADQLKRLEMRGHVSFANRLRTVSPPGPSTNSSQVIKSLLNDNDDPDGSKHLVASMMKRFGIGGKPDFKTSLEKLDWACDKKLPDAMVTKANILTGMDIGAPKYPEAFKLYSDAVEKKHAYAQGQLGMLYALGLGVEHNWDKAVALLSASASTGDPESQYMLAGFYTDGRGVKPDRKKAVELFERAARQGHEDAMLELGIICGSSEFPDLKEDKVKSEFWLRSAVSYGFQEANYYLGTMLAGRGSTEAAFKAFEEAANHGHLLSQIQVGRYYMNQEKFKLAHEWFDKALAQGSLTTPRELQILAVREAILGNNRRAKTLVTAASLIRKGTVINKSMLSSTKNTLEEEENDWQNDILVRPEPAVGATAAKDIEEGTFVSATSIEFPDKKVSELPEE